MSTYTSSTGSFIAYNYSSSRRSTSGTSSSSRTSSSSHSSYGYERDGSSSGNGSAGTYPRQAVYRDPVSGGQRTETKTRVNSKKQEVCVTNYNQRNNDRGEPRTEYRDASRYYSR